MHVKKGGSMNTSLKYAPKWKLFLYTFLAIISSLGNVVIAYVTKVMLNSAQNHQGSVQLLVVTATIGSLTLIAIMFINFGFRYLKNDIVQDINLNLKKHIVTYLIYNQKDSQKDGMSLLTNNMKQVETAKIQNELLVIYQGITFIIAVSVGLINSWLLTLIFMVTTLIPGFIQKFFTKNIQEKSKIWEDNNAIYTQKVSDGLNGAKTVALYDVQPVLIKKIINSASNMEVALKKFNYTQGAVGELILAIANVFSFIIPFLIGAILMFNNQIGAGTLVMIIQLSNDFINPVVDIFQRYNAIKSTDSIWSKVSEALNFKIDDSVNEAISDFNSLKVSNLSYEVPNKQLFDNVNFDVKPKDKVLLMAPSGWGKTTLLSILLGRIAPSSGKVEINQVDETGNWKKLHSYFSYINQKPFIFDDSLEYNITLGRKVSSEKLNYVINQAGLKDLIEEKGLNYQVGEKGNKLSGGQIQRIEIARALLAERPIILADEATSSLDPELSLAIHKTILEQNQSAVVEVAHKVTDEERAMFTKIVKFSK